MKHKAIGNIERLKARLMVKGHTQIEGLNYTKTFSIMAKIVLVKTLFSCCIYQKGWSIYQMNVSDAFLHGDLSEDIYMSPPLMLGTLGSAN